MAYLLNSGQQAQIILCVNELSDAVSYVDSLLEIAGYEGIQLPLPFLKINLLKSKAYKKKSSLIAGFFYGFNKIKQLAS